MVDNSRSWLLYNRMLRLNDEEDGKEREVFKQGNVATI